MAYVQKNNPVPKTGCGRRRVSAMENPFKSKTLESVSKGLKKASNMHAGQKSAARAKFDVYPGAYANMWASNHKC